jgi:hypothetical protein
MAYRVKLGAICPCNTAACLRLVEGGHSWINWIYLPNPAKFRGTRRDGALPMASTARAKPTVRPLWGTRNGMLLALAVVSSAIAWWMIAWPPLTLANIDKHAGHFAITYAHVLGGSGMLLFGGINLYLAAARTNFPLHRLVGRAYLACGTLGATAAIAVTSTMAHKPAGGPILTNATVSLLTLATAWLAFATLGWRAASNRRFVTHGQWMIRSYVLAWSFVFCRIASRLSNIDELGNGEAFIWLSWVGPLLICETVLQWPEGSRKGSRPSAPLRD